MLYRGATLAWAMFGCVTLMSFVPSESARIMVVELTGGISHWKYMSSIARSLLAGGHELTVFAPFANMDSCRDNCTLVDLSRDFASHSIRNMSYGKATESFTSIASFMATYVNITRSRCDVMYNHREIRKTVQEAEYRSTVYDVLLVDPRGFECVSYLATALRVPVVYSFTAPMFAFTEFLFLGNAPNPAVVAHLMNRSAVLRTFTQRFVNSVLTAYSHIAYAYYQWVAKWTHPRSYDFVTVSKPSVVFVNSYYATERSRPLPHNFISIGGVHIKRPETISSDILKFIEDSPHGVIYFTFGSVVSMSTLPENIHNAFKEALAQIPQRVLWKYEGEMKDKPKNVMTSKWFPQRDILLHPKVKLFISHGGISGVYEAVDAGVPVLGFPLFYDQPRNIDNLVEAGMAISMDLLSVQKDELLTNILEIINNEKYMKNAKIASSIFKDRPMTPEQSVVYWTEYVIRHKGAPHLMSDGLFLTWYQYFLLDVIAVLLVLIFLVFFIVYKAFEQICKCFSKKSQCIKIKPE